MNQSTIFFNRFPADFLPASGAAVFETFTSLFRKSNEADSADVTESSDTDSVLMFIPIAAVVIEALSCIGAAATLLNCKKSAAVLEKLFSE